MRLETYLDAMILSQNYYILGAPRKRLRQYRAFRARILKINELQKAEIDEYYEETQQSRGKYWMLKRKKDDQIAKLKKELEECEQMYRDDMGV